MIYSKRVSCNQHYKPATVRDTTEYIITIINKS